MAEPVGIRRIVTGHDASGKAVVLQDSPTPNVKVRPVGGFVSHLVWATDESPADINTGTDRADRVTGTAPPPNGTIFRVVDFPPEGGKTHDREAMLQAMGLKDESHAEGARHAFMHRTKSVDYALVLSGEIDMLLDDSEVHMKAGDVMVQQATNHAWVNRGTEVCRIAFVLVDAVEHPHFSK